SGYLLLAKRLRDSPDRFSGSWNFGPTSTDVRTVRDVAEFISARLGQGTISVDAGNQSGHEARLLQLKCDKAHQLLGWEPRWGVDRTLAMTADWYKAVLSGSQASAVTREQL